MLIWFIPFDHRRHRFRIERDGSRVEVTLETRSLLLHDLAHYAYESSWHVEDGFYGLLYQGVELATLRTPSELGEARHSLLMAIEGPVARLQSSFKRDGPKADEASQQLRALWGAWKKTRQGQALQLQWPAGIEPNVVAAPS